MIPMAGGKHRKPKDSSSTRKSAALILGASVASPVVLASQAEAAPVSAWDRIAECESGGRWNLPYGDASSTGGLQIQQPTWNDYGGQAYAPQPYQATKAQQIMIAEKILAGQGPGAWVCNARVGYPLQSSGPNSSHLKGGTNPYAAAPAAPVKPAPKPKPAAPSGGGGKAGHDHVTVESGDTLYGISVTLGAGKGDDNWRPLWEANRDRVKDPDLIFPGQRLNVPDSWSGKSYKAPEKPQAAPSKPATPPPVSTPSADVVLPVQGRIGDSILVGSGGSLSRTAGGHSGLDITAPQGTPVKAAMAGEVVSVNRSGAAYGQHVVIKHSGGVFTLYAHLSAITVSVGQDVTAGQPVGNVGSTGTSSGPHLHFEVRNHPTAFLPSTFLNPLSWLRSHGVTV